jgi:hypothetical protein
MRYKIILLVLSIIFTFKLKAQNSTLDYTYYDVNEFSYLDLAIGGSYLYNKSINEDYNWGVNINMKLRFETKYKRLAISPIFGYKLYSIEIDNNNSVKDDLTVIKVGAQTDFRLFMTESEDFSIWNILELNYSFISEDLRWEESNSSYFTTQNSSTTESVNIFKGQKPSVLLGYRIQYKWFYIEGSYDLLNSQVELSKELVQELQSSNVEFEKTQKIDLNTMNIMFGISTSFEQLSKLYFPRF